MFPGQIILLLAALCLLLATGCSAEALYLVRNGKSDYTVVLSESASPSEKTAAAELIDFVGQISGAELPLVTGDLPPNKKAVIVGDGEALRALGVKIDFESLGDEGFSIVTHEDCLVIAGGRQRGTMYGVYRFLEGQLGCRFYTPHVTHVPKNPTIQIDRLSISEKPDFEFRDMWFGAAQNEIWASRNAVNGHHTNISPERGSSVKYGLFVHTFVNLLHEDIYFQEHPEYFALVDGKRMKGPEGQPCLTNPAVLDEITKNVLKKMEENPGARIFSVSQNDNSNYCRCEECAKIDEEEGSHIGSLIRFVNALARRVGEVYPDKIIDTLAYVYTEKPPLLTKPDPNVMIRLCTAVKCQYHEYEKCPKNAEFVSHLKGWHEITNNLYIWHYLSNFSGGHIAPWPDLGQIPTTMQLIKRMGVRGVFLQGCIHCGGNEAGEGAWMMDLKAYLGAKLLWDANADARAIREDFLKGFYGKAAGPIGEFLDYLDDKVKSENIHGMEYQGIGAYNIMPWTDLEYRKKNLPTWTWGLSENDLLTPEVMDKARQCFEKAKHLAENEQILARVKNSELGIDYVDVMREVDKAVVSDSAEVKSMALEKLTDLYMRFKANGIKLLIQGDLDSQYNGLKAALLGK